jgi:hypothetical protein
MEYMEYMGRGKIKKANFGKAKITRECKLKLDARLKLGGGG